MVRVHKSLIGGSLILLITFNIYNFINFIFQFSMARLLNVVDYGILVSLFSIIYLTGIFSESIQLLIAKYSSSETDNGKIKNIIKRTIKKSLKISLCIFLLYLIISIFLSNLLKIPFPLMAITGTLIFSSFLLPISRGVMQGKKKFTSLGINLIIESSVKLILSILLVFIGWNIYGPLVGTIIGTALAFLLSFFSIKEIIYSKESVSQTLQLKIDAVPMFVVNLCILAFYTIDVLIAKIVFTPEIAGYYAIASILSKTVFWGTQPISKAMFPISAETGKKKNVSRQVLINSSLLLALGIIFALAISFFFSDFIVHLYSGKIISQSANILFYLMISTSLISLTNLLLIYKLSSSKIKNPYLFMPFILIEVILLSVFSKNLIQFSFAYIISSSIFLLGSILISNKSKLEIFKNPK